VVRPAPGAAAHGSPGTETARDPEVLGSQTTRTGPSTLPATGLAVLGLAWTGVGLVVVGIRLRRIRGPGLR
jgi:hypothetical protein